MNIQQDNSKQNARTRHIDIRLTQKEYEAIVEKAAASVAAHFLYKFMIIKLFHYKIYSMWADNYFEIARFKYNIAVGIRK